MHGSTPKHPFFQRLHHALVLAQVLGDHDLDARHAAVFPVGDAVAAEEQIDRDARNREGENQNDPRHLIRRIASAGHNGQHRNPRNHTHCDTHPVPVFAQPVHPRHYKQDLQQNTQRHHNHALKQQLRQIPHRRTSFRFFPYCQYNTFAASLQAGIAVLNFCLKILLVSNRRLCYNSTLQITPAGTPAAVRRYKHAGHHPGAGRPRQ